MGRNSIPVFKQILNFKVQFSNVNILSLQDLLETSRFLCVDQLVSEIEEHLKLLFHTKDVKFEDCLVALNLSVGYKFTRFSDLLLCFINLNLSNICLLTEFEELTDCSMQALLREEVQLKLFYSQPFAKKMTHFCHKKIVKC